jgi:Ca2+-binding EF-hand superfamily protein
MTTAVRNRKLARRFELMDANGDGFLEYKDYQAFAARLVQGFHESPDSPKARALAEAYSTFWHDFIALMDTDGDQRVSLDEFVTAMEDGLAAGPDFDRIIGPQLKAVLNLADTNGDGRLDAAEYEALMRLIGLREDEITTGFQRLDRDGDGYLTLGEMSMAAKEYYVSNDPSATGSSLFGTY